MTYIAYQVNMLQVRRPWSEGGGSPRPSLSGLVYGQYATRIYECIWFRPSLDMKRFFDFATVALLFICDKHCPIMG